jgi:hypothetical protein
MKLNKILVSAIAPLITLLPQLTPIANAQSVVRGRCNLEIVGQDKGSRVNLRSGPGVEFDVVGYVLVGQKVNGLRYDGGAAVRQSDTEGVYWDYVEYVPSGTRGWIAKFLLGDRCFDVEGGR